VGITVPKLLPITGTFAPAFAIYHIILALRVSAHRKATKTSLGSKAEPTKSGQLDDLNVATRCHGNYAENVPFALLLGAIVEMNGGNRRVLTGGLAALLVGRLLHAELGLRSENAMGQGRLIGHLTTLSFILSMGGYAAWLVKGYWGL
jgi:uncharacterized protein